MSNFFQLLSPRCRKCRAHNPFIVILVIVYIINVTGVFFFFIFGWRRYASDIACPVEWHFKRRVATRCEGSRGIFDTVTLSRVVTLVELRGESERREGISEDGVRVGVVGGSALRFGEQVYSDTGRRPRLVSRAGGHRYICPL